MNCIVAFETSCDETGVAIVSTDGSVIFDKTKTQLVHKKFSGVVPELASREHILYLQEIWGEIKTEIDLKKLTIVAIAATSGPGLIGSLLTGVMFARGIAYSLNIPFVPINHLDAHIMSLVIKNKNGSIFIEKMIDEPFISLLISGGHCQFLINNGIAKYTYLGGSIDDSVGEAFDKVAKMLNLDYPGGPEIEKMAKSGKADSYKLPMPLCNQENCHMSFSGLKTAVYYLIKKQIECNNLLTKEFVCNLSASFQDTVAKILTYKTKIAVESFQQIFPNQKTRIFVCGGVSANNYIRNYLEQSIDVEVIYPLIQYTTDNALMVASAMLHYYQNNQIPQMSEIVKSRWPLKDLSTEILLFN